MNDRERELLTLIHQALDKLLEEPTSKREFSMAQKVPAEVIDTIQDALRPRRPPCVDFYGGKCHSLTHMCPTCPDRGT